MNLIKHHHEKSLDKHQDKSKGVLDEEEQNFKSLMATVIHEYVHRKVTINAGKT